MTACWYETCSCLLKHKKMLHGVVTVAVWSPYMQKSLDYWKMGHLKYDWPKWMLTKRKTLPQSSTWAVFPLLNSSMMAIGKMPPIFQVMHLFVCCICMHHFHTVCSINTSSWALFYDLNRKANSKRNHEVAGEAHGAERYCSQWCEECRGSAGCTWCGCGWILPGKWPIICIK